MSEVPGWPRSPRRLRRCYPHHGLAIPLHSTERLLGVLGLDLDAATAELDGVSPMPSYRFSLQLHSAVRLL
jgi:hypothetical protein